MITAGELNGSHLGLDITVAEGSFVITGQLIEVLHTADTISDGTFSNPDQVVLGRAWVRVIFRQSASATVSPNARVEVL